MSDFMPRGILTDLWEEILKRHWTYLETEECVDKLENRKKLEGCLMELVCKVQHDRKFFLPETAKVLKNSVQDLENFNAQKGISAFESISQYANNLFTKPWRKEFHILNLYSGFYQHEIKSNLVDAEILFEAMGYRRMSKDTLVLDGPICPDQVTNVSRDAMIAYVELQIIKQIHTGLDAIGINCSLLDIYLYRENYTGNTTQAVKDLANSFEEKRYRSRQKVIGDNYGYIDVQPSSNYFVTTKRGPSECQCSVFQQPHSVSRQRLIPRANGVCCVPENREQSLTTTNLVYSNMRYPVQQDYQHHHSGMSTENGGVQLSQMSHSRSLEHYSEPPNHYNNLLPHRHSFDHPPQGCTAHNHYHNSHQQKLQHLQQHPHYYQHLNKARHHFYESPYDCIDGNSLGGGSSIISYAAVAANSAVGNAAFGVGSSGVVGNCNFNPNSTYSHPYNVSGNRFPLPFNISNQLLYENPQSNNYNDPQEPAYAHITDHNTCPISKLAPNIMKSISTYEHINNQSVEQPPLAKDSRYRQRSRQSEQLINFDDAITIKQFDPYCQYHPNFDTNNHSIDKHLNVRNGRDSSLSASSVHAQQHCGPGHPSTNDDTYVYAKPTPKENRKPSALNTSLYPYHNSGERGDTTDISYDSANDVNIPSTESEHNHQSSPQQSTKNQDGVGSVERWISVYQNAEKKSYSKDLGERKDLLVQSLDLDSLNINNDTSASQSSTSDKRNSFHSGNENRTAVQQKQQSESKTYSKADAFGISSSTKKLQKQKSSLDNNTKKVKTAPKQNKPASKPNSNISRSQSRSNDNKPVSNTVNNNNNNIIGNSVSGSSQNKKSSSSVVNTSKISPSIATTQIIVTSANEWGCKFCTFLNPNSKFVCEMCGHSKSFKGFKVDSSSSTSAGATSMTHNTPTCA